MRVLITGAAGFIGSNLADELIEQGHTVTGVDDLSTGRLSNIGSQSPMEFILGDIRTDLIPYGPYDVIYHAAASYKDRDDWERDASTNVLGTINVVREAKRTGAKIVYFQTSLCYGLSPRSPVETSAQLDPRGSYAVSKTAGEAYIRDSGVEYVSLRLANIYGPRNLSGPVPTFYQRLVAGETCTVVDSRRDFVFIDDLVRIAIQVATEGRGIYHVSSGRDVAIAEIYEWVVTAMGIEDAPEPKHVPRGADDAASILLDHTETLRELGWAARTPLVSGIRQAIDWYKANGVTETYTHLSPMEAKG
jgi:UDP-glucose 4-epimerase